MMIASSLFERVNTDVPYAKFMVTFPLARVLALAPITLNWPGPIKRSVVMLNVCTFFALIFKVPVFQVDCRVSSIVQLKPFTCSVAICVRIIHDFIDYNE
jgi:hypothetical protein